jgi:hypothetical protein
LIIMSCRQSRLSTCLPSARVLQIISPTICDRDNNMRLASHNATHDTSNVATTDHNTDTMDHSMQSAFVSAFSKLNKQRIRLSNMAAEGEDPDTTQNTSEAQEAVDALQKV